MKSGITEDYLSIKKALLLYDWIGDKEIKDIEGIYKIYGGTIRKSGEGFSWLADSLTAVAESLGWSKKENQKEIPCRSFFYFFLCPSQGEY